MFTRSALLALALAIPFSACGGDDTPATETDTTVIEVPTVDTGAMEDAASDAADAAGDAANSAADAAADAGQAAQDAASSAADAVDATVDTLSN